MRKMSMTVVLAGLALALVVAGSALASGGLDSGGIFFTAVPLRSLADHLKRSQPERTRQE